MSQARLTPPTFPRLADDIVALATPAGSAARAIVRLTGPTVRQRLAGLLSDAPDSINVSASSPDRTPSWLPVALRLPAWEHPVMADLYSWYEPRSLTGQDLLEIGLFGAPPLVQDLLDTLLAAGCRLAQPGEFLWRAFLAGKFDLPQVDAISAMLCAGSRDELRRAAQLAFGGQLPPLTRLRDEVLNLLAEIEAGLDFAAEDLTFLAPQEITSRLDHLAAALRQILDRLTERAQPHHRPRVVLAGPPNAGKSSLFNALLGRDLALVSPQVGTTRDYLLSPLTLGPAQVVDLIDTAGWDPGSAATFEQAAQQLRDEQTRLADLVLWCQETTDLSPPPAWLAELPVLFVRTKGDLASLSSSAGGILVSSHTGQGLDQLREEISRRVRQAVSSVPAPTLTCGLELVRQADQAVTAARELLDQQAPPELLAVDLRLALDALGQLVGAVYTEDLLGRVFSQFCIGK
jgi:tRNA modification GTPase